MFKDLFQKVKDTLFVKVPATDAVPTPAWYAGWKTWIPIVLAVAALGGWGVTAVQALRDGKPIPPLPTPNISFQERPDECAPDTYSHAFGWSGDKEVVAAAKAKLNPIEFAGTPAGRAVTGDADVFLWRAVRKASGKPETDPWYPNIDQGPVGCCVGAGYKHCSDIAVAMAAINQPGLTWKATSAEVVYGGSRIEIGKGQLGSQDGSVGAWAADWVVKYGIVPMEKYDSTDLTVFSPTRARTFGKSGVPADIESVAKEHPVKTAALVKTWADVNRAIQQGYPVAVCSMQGFTMTRDRDGFARAQGQWPHCMAIVGVRGGARPGAFILNSWGNNVHTGPVWPADAPVAGFWADAATVGKMVAEQDSYALSDATGFPSRDLVDWFADAKQAPQTDWLAERNPGNFDLGFSVGRARDVVLRKQARNNGFVELAH